MLRSIHLALFIFSAFLISCTENENISNNSNPVVGKWNLIKISGGLQGVNKSYPSGQITWDLTLNNTVIVENNSDNTFDEFLQTGIHNYVIENQNSNDCLGEIKVNTINIGCTNVNGNTLTIDQHYNDGFLLIFEK